MKTYKELLKELRGTGIPKQKEGSPPLKITKSAGGHEMHSHDGEFIKRGHSSKDLEDFAKKHGHKAEGP